MYDGWRLADSHEIGDYPIEPGDTIDAMFQQVGGGGLLCTPSVLFTDVSNESAMEKLELATEGPSWTIVKPGLCVEGERAAAFCYYAECQPLGQPVGHVHVTCERCCTHIHAHAHDYGCNCVPTPLTRLTRAHSHAVQKANDHFQIEPAR